MKKIDKEDSPKWFEKWKLDYLRINGREAHYKSDFSSDENRRRKLRESLIEEQGHICCYCMKKIFLDNSHIEHFWPKTFFPQIDLEYNNIFASCNSFHLNRNRREAIENSEVFDEEEYSNEAMQFLQFLLTK